MGSEDEQAMQLEIADLRAGLGRNRAILAQLVSVDPLRFVWAGHESHFACVFCSKTSVGREDEMHRPGCPYVAARVFLGE